jgi:hypothetical protein
MLEHATRHLLKEARQRGIWHADLPALAQRCLEQDFFGKARCKDM